MNVNKKMSYGVNLIKTYLLALFNYNTRFDKINMICSQKLNYAIFVSTHRLPFYNCLSSLLFMAV